MRKKNYKGRCTKKKVAKCAEVFRGYDALMTAYVDELSKDENIAEIRCNVGLEESEYMTDFVCTQVSGEQMVRECVFRKLLAKPLTVKMLDESRNYWLSKGVLDWGIVIDEE